MRATKAPSLRRRRRRLLHGIERVQRLRLRSQQLSLSSLNFNGKAKFWELSSHSLSLLRCVCLPLRLWSMWLWPHVLATIFLAVEAAVAPAAAATVALANPQYVFCWWNETFFVNIYLLFTPVVGPMACAPWGNPRKKRNTKNWLDIALVAWQARSGCCGKSGGLNVATCHLLWFCGSTTKSCQTRRILNINYIDSTNTKAKQTHFVIPPVSNLFCACPTENHTKSNKICPPSHSLCALRNW